MAKLQKLAGRFGKLSVLRIADKKIINAAGRVYYYLCRCDCGRIEEISGSALRQGRKAGIESRCSKCRAKAISLRRKGKRGDNSIATYRRKNGAPATYVPAMLAPKRKLYEEQEGLCACCGESLPLEFRKSSWDHDHANGNLRGLVHHNCNVVIGYLENYPGIAVKAQEYLDRYKDQGSPQGGS